jgi:DNA-binding transcriptional ArsR family regulator
MDSALDAAALVGLLADPIRRRVVAAMILGASTFDEVVSMTDVEAPAVAVAVGRLSGAGLVITADDNQLYVLEEAFAVAARVALSQPRSTEHDNRPADQRRIFEAFVADDRITSIPMARQKRLVLLDWLAQAFEPGRRYSEHQVNVVILRHHPDTSAWRRYLVDEGFLDRADGEYWRSGGTIAT